LELEWLALEENVVEAPSLGSQDRRHAGLALLDEEGDVHGTGAGITCSPRLPGHSVGGMTVSTQRLAVSPCLGDGIDSLVTVETQELRDNGSTSDLDEDDVIETDTVEGVEKGKTSLDLVSLNHARKDVMDGEFLTLASEMIGDGEDGTQVVRWVTPFRGEETVIEVEPSDHRSNVERAPDGVELIVGSGNSSTLIGGKRTTSASSDHKEQRKVVPFGTVVPSTTGPRSFEHSGNLRPSRPHPMVSIRQSLAVSYASSEVIL